MILPSVKGPKCELPHAILLAAYTRISLFVGRFLLRFKDARKH